MTDRSGTRSIEVGAERLAGWLERFADRHPVPVAGVEDDQLVLVSPDGARAAIDLPAGPLPGLGDPVAELLTVLGARRRLGVLVVRRRGHAVGVFDGSELVSGRHHGHYVQGRTKAGGWSQQRYARRRTNQAAAAYAAAAADAAEVLAPVLGDLAGLVTGGDRAGVEAVLARPELAGLAALPRRYLSGVPDPNAGVLAGLGARLTAVRIELNEAAQRE